MPAAFVCNLGGFSVKFSPNILEGKFENFNKIEQFLVQTEPDITYSVHFQLSSSIHKSTSYFETDEKTWKIFPHNGKIGIKVTSPEQDPYQLALLSKDFKSGEIFVAKNNILPDTYILPTAYPLGELIMMNILGSGYGVMCHACGVINRGNGYLFTGHGHDGKTTTAHLWAKMPETMIVNDDKVIVRNIQNRYDLFGTPWHGEGGWALPNSAPLKRIFILKQAPKNEVKDLSPATAVGKLFARAFLPLWDSKAVSYSLDFFEKLCQSVPVQELGFLPEPSIVDFVRHLD